MIESLTMSLMPSLSSWSYTAGMSKASQLTRTKSVIDHRITKTFSPATIYPAPGGSAPSGSDTSLRTNAPPPRPGSTALVPPLQTPSGFPCIVPRGRSVESKVAAYDKETHIEGD